MLLLVGYITSRKGSNKEFFTAGKNSPWYLIAFGMIGTSISGVTFISVPGAVYLNSFAYFQFVIGNFFGYLVIIYILMPMYYRLNLTSIYTYLDGRYGRRTYLTGSGFFLLSRTIGAAVRLYLVARVFQIFVFNQWHFPFELSVLLSVGLILVYSIKGGIKTIIWTDTLQTLFLVASLVLMVGFISQSLNIHISDLFDTIKNSSYSKIFFFDTANPKAFLARNYFPKQFISGMFITIAMTGLDQDLMQKNLTCRSLKDAQKNMFVFSFIFMGVVLLFLSLGALMYMYANKNGIALPAKSDDLLPILALHYFPAIVSFVFIIGLTAAAFASADSALTALTTSFCVDFLRFGNNSTKKGVKTRYGVHIGFSVLIILVIYIFNYFNNSTIIDAIFKIASYTYGPLLGLYAFGLQSQRRVDDSLIPIICVFAPIIVYFFEILLKIHFGSYTIANETLILNGLLVYLGIYALSKKKRYSFHKNTLI